MIKKNQMLGQEIVYSFSRTDEGLLPVLSFQDICIARALEGKALQYLPSEKREDFLFLFYQYKDNFSNR